MASLVTLKAPPGTPRHLCRPPFGIKHPQTEQDANNAPLISLPKALIPGVFGKAIRPPRMEFGCWIEDQQMREIAERLGCLEEARGFPLDWRVLFALRDKLGVDMRLALVYTGITGANVGSAYGEIYSFGSNYDLNTSLFRTGGPLPKLMKILGIQRSDLQWWASQDDWKWKYVNLERERWLKECNVRAWNEWEEMILEIQEEHQRKEAEKTNEEVAEAPET